MRLALIAFVDDVVASLRRMLKEEHKGDIRLSDLITVIKKTKRLY